MRTRLFTEQRAASHMSPGIPRAWTRSFRKAPRLDQKEARWRSPWRKNTQHTMWDFSFHCRPCPPGSLDDATSEAWPAGSVLQCAAVPRAPSPATRAGPHQHAPGRAHSTEGSRGEGCPGCDGEGGSSSDRRTKEALRLEKTAKSIKSNRHPNPTKWFDGFRKASLGRSCLLSWIQTKNNLGLGILRLVGRYSSIHKATYPKYGTRNNIK